ncbi:MAG: hypothetical protein Q9M94_03800 [Candidatus Gracilibacteria bacterium]|nr:hypothetical protein [Candidatus Gracilibacteria bacterium]
MQNILDRIKKVEALIDGAKSDGEKNAAIAAKERILKKYPEIDIKNNIVEYTIKTADSWHKKLFVAICRKYDIEPYRYYRQRYTTVMIKVNETFLNEILWKEYLQYTDILEELVGGITDELISKIHKEEDDTILKGKLN